MNINNTIIVILVAIILFLGYTNYNYKPEVITKIDTIYKEIRLNPIKLIDTFKLTKVKNNYIEVKILDTTKIKTIDSLLIVNDSIQNNLKSLITQKAILDTIFNKDTLFISYEIFNKIWDVNLKFYPRFEKVTRETIYISDDNKYYYLGGGFIGGLILGVLIK